MKSIKTTISGSCAALGLALVGIGDMPMKDSSNIEVLWYLKLAGYVCGALGVFFGHLFAADSASMDEVKHTLSEVPKAIETGDTSFLKKSG